MLQCGGGVQRRGRRSLEWRRTVEHPLAAKGLAFGASPASTRPCVHGSLESQGCGTAGEVYTHNKAEKGK